MIEGVQKRSKKVKNLYEKMKMRKKNWEIDQNSFIGKYIDIFVRSLQIR